MRDTSSLREHRVLLVEDNPGDADLIREYLTDARADVPDLQVVGTLKDALEVLEGGGDPAFSAVLLDLNLPDSSGLETLRAVADREPRAAIVVLTGVAEEEMGVEALRGGAEDFLPKGVLTPEVLTRVIRYAIERQRMHDQVRRSRDRFRATFEVGPDGRLVADDEGRIREVNETLAQLFGYRRQELIGMEVEELVPEGHRAAHEGQRQAYQRDPTVRPMGKDLNLRGRRKDGTTFPADVSLSPFTEEDELRVLVVVRDVSERIRREENLRFQAELLDAVGDAVIATDLDGTVRYWNQAAEELYGWSREEVLGRDVVELTPSDRSRDQARGLMEALRAGEAWSGEFEVRRKDGSTFPALVTNAPLEEDGELVGIIGVSTDISRIVEAEQELAHTNRALRVVSAANQAVIRSASEEEILDEVCRIAVEEGGYELAWIGFASSDPERSVRPVASRGRDDGYLDELEVTWSAGKLGQGPTGTAIRTRAPSVVRDTERDPDYEPWSRAALERGFRSSAALPLVHRDQCLGALKIYACEPDAFDEEELEILSELGEDLAHGIIVHREREKRERLQVRLQEAEKLRAVGQLAGGIAHDFNNYLTVITTLTDLLLDSPEIEDEAAGDLQEIRDAATRSALLTRQLLTFSHRDLRAPSVVSLNQAVRESGAMLDRLLGERVEVETELGPDARVPEVFIDRGQFEQVLMNLAINGRDAMPEGGVLTIRTRREEIRGTEAARDGALEAGTYAVLEVADTGTGIDEAVRDRLFEPFFTTKETGTGLGLATVYGIVTGCGGEIRVETETGRGTAFTVLLPEAPADAPGEGSPGGPARGQELGGTETVLVVEDEDAVRSVCRRILERYGYRVLEAASAAEAVRVSRDAGEEIHAALVDVTLPDGTGPEVAERLRAQRPDLSVVFGSGYTVEEVDASLPSDAPFRYVEKPYEAVALARSIRAALDD